jgi:hypothetical protein
VGFGLATAESAGLVGTGVQSFAGVKTFESGVKLDEAAVQSTLNFYSEDTWNYQLSTTDDGFSSNEIVTLRYVRIGSIVTLFIPDFVGNSSAAYMSLGSMPSAIRPVRVTTFELNNYYSNSVLTAGAGAVIYIPASSASGIIGFYTTGALVSGFSVSGTKGIPNPICITYSLI